MPASNIDFAEVIDLGRMPYGQALEIQLIWHQKVLAGAKPVILTVEHEPVLTVGKNSDQKNLLFPVEFYKNSGIDFYETERGGEVTAHMPGQLVVYPIIDVANRRLSVRDYINGLEEAVIGTLNFFGIKADRDPEHPGVWVETRKICAIGVRVKSRVTLHGLALNVNNSLDLFGKIIPCGIRSRGVTSMKEQLSAPLDMLKVRDELLKRISSKIS